MTKKNVLCNSEHEGECFTVMCNLLNTENCAPAETKPVRTHAVAKVETETWSPFKGTAVCLGLLCLVLLTAVIAVGVQCEYSETENMEGRTERGCIE